MEAVRKIESGRQQPLWRRRDSEPGPEVGDTPGGKESRGVSGAETLRRAVLAAAILLAPIVLIPGTILNPAIGGIGQAAADLAANAGANALTDQLHVAAYVLESFLLPLSVLGLAGLAMRRSPWLGTIGGGLGVVGWLPFSALAAQDDLTLRMAEMGAGARFVALWDKFTTDSTMMTFLLVYVVCHLVAYVLLPIALWRGRWIPAWAAWAIALTSPLTIAGFASRQIAVVGLLICALLLAGSIPAGRAVWRSRM